MNRKQKSLALLAYAKTAVKSADAYALKRKKELNESFNRLNGIFATLASIGVKTELLTIEMAMNLARGQREFEYACQQSGYEIRYRTIRRMLESQIFLDEMRKVVEFEVTFGEHIVSYSISEEACQHLPRDYLIKQISHQLAETMAHQLPSYLGQK